MKGICTKHGEQEFSVNANMDGFCPVCLEEQLKQGVLDGKWKLESKPIDSRYSMGCEVRKDSCEICADGEMFSKIQQGISEELLSNQHIHVCDQVFLDRSAKLIFEELRRAEEKFPDWPDDLLHGFAIVSEEFGEAQKAVLDYVYHRGDLKRYREELIQTAAMAIRALADLDAGGLEEPKSQPETVDAPKVILRQESFFSGAKKRVALDPIDPNAAPVWASRMDKFKGQIITLECHHEFHKDWWQAKDRWQAGETEGDPWFAERWLEDPGSVQCCEERPEKVI